ncbi:MAG: phosphotransferase family protein, partial [Aeromicrobium sp.]
LLAYQRMSEAGGAAKTNVVTDAPRAPGYLTPEEIVERYSRAAGRDVSHLGFHLGLAFFKLAVILEGIHYRHAQGHTVGAGFDGIGDMIAPLIDAGRAAIR